MCHCDFRIFVLITFGFVYRENVVWFWLFPSLDWAEVQTTGVLFLNNLLPVRGVAEEGHYNARGCGWWGQGGINKTGSNDMIKCWNGLSIFLSETAQCGQILKAFLSSLLAIFKCCTVLLVIFGFCIRLECFWSCWLGVRKKSVLVGLIPCHYSSCWCASCWVTLFKETPKGPSFLIGSGWNLPGLFFK